MANEKKSPWAWIIGGCCLGLLLVGAVILSLGGFAAFKLKQFGETMTDPVKREQKALEILGTNAAPEGYFGAMGIEVPFFFEMAILGDKPPSAEDPEPSFDQRGFLFFKMIQFGNQDHSEIEDFFRGDSSDPEVLREQGINLNLKERVARGELETNGAQVLWSAHLGSLSFEASDHEGLNSLLQISCSQDDKARFGVWFGPDPLQVEEASLESDSLQELDSAEEVTEQTLPDYSGTVADGEALKSFLDHFDLCNA